MNFWVRRSLLVNLRGLLILLLLWIPLSMLLWQLLAGLGIPATWEQRIWFGVLLLVTISTVRLFDRMPLSWAGIGAHPWLLRELGIGLLLGAAIATIAWIPIALCGGRFTRIARTDILGRR